MRKDLSYYLKLDYPIEIKKIPKKDGGGYLASIPQLGEKAFRADGRNVKEALRNLRRVKKDLFIDYLEERTPIPEPELEPESIFSGKFVVRITPALHRELVERARKEDVSLNHLVVSLLSYNISLRTVEKKIDHLLGTVKGMQYSVPIAREHYPQYIEFKLDKKLIGEVGR